MLAKSVPPPRFVSPRSGVAIDLDAPLKALPAKATGKGIYFADLFKVAEGKLSAEELAQRAGVPHRRYVAFMDYPYADLLKLTLEVAKVAIVPGEAFGAPGYARISFALGDDDLGEGVRRIADLLSN